MAYSPRFYSRFIIGLGLLLSMSAGFAQAPQPSLTVKQLMNVLITPATNTIWGAYQLQTDADWQEVANAALVVIAAADLLASGGAGEGEGETAGEAQWQADNTAMIEAAQQVLAAVAERDEAALSEAGNNALYPPCESCHQRYQSR